MNLYFMVSSLAVIVVMGCGPQSNGIIYKDLELVPYVEDYLSYKQKYGLYPANSFPMTIEFGNLDTNKGGVCEIQNIKVGDNKRTDRRIIIDRRVWALLNEVQREILIAHEMGHCDLDIRHHLDYGPNIMNTFILDYNVYLAKKDELLKNLFRRQ